MQSPTRDMLSTEWTPRAYCDGCERPPLVCICSALVTVAPRTKVVVLQHPRESDNPIGTAWMVERCLSARRIVGVELENDPELVAALGDPAAPAILLAPGPSAIDLATSPPTGPVTLVVVDGTWAHARKLLRVNPSLGRLPRYAFTPATPSNYRIRKEPAAHCVSTIEATVAALRYLDRGADAPDLQPVLSAFDAMVDHQVRIAGERSSSRHKQNALARSLEPKKPRKMPLSGMPLVVTYAEANAWPRGTEYGPTPELAHLVAERVRTGERFEAFVAPRQPLSPGFTRHSGVPEVLVLEGESRESFRARFAAFIGDDVLTAWGEYVMNLLRRDGFAPKIDVRISAIQLLGRPAGDAVGMAEALGCTVDAPWAIGRTGVRHAAAVAIARVLTR